MEQASCFAPFFASANCHLTPIFFIDTREKLLAYRLLPSLREYLLLRQDRLQADLYQRGTDGRWTHQCLLHPDDVLALHCADATVSLRDVYADVPELLAN